MDVCRCFVAAGVLLFSVGCTVTASSSESSKKHTLNLGPLIGLVGMAVDGDDKDDYEHFFEEDCDCKCSRCRD